ncbi:hypothetical protein [Tardiphaga sp. 862_B3_N1_1]|uniref:hypothetical protein n=1 Tax=Tardiphaga sp. 862_B3_N1_1 TaxID=3240763 RepID=UPI003F894C3C
MKLLTNLARAAAAVALSPVAAAADVLTLPSSAYNNRPPFRRTEQLLRRAGKCVDAATTPATE